MLKKLLTIEYKIMFLIFLAVLAVAAAGIIAYRGLNFVLTSIEKEAQPNLSLIVLKEINAKIQQGENNIEYYLLTSESRYLEPYNDVIGNIGNKINTLKLYNRDNQMRMAQIDTIQILLDQKFTLWDEMLTHSNFNSVNDALSKLAESLDTQSDTVTLKVRKSVTVEVKTDSNLLAETPKENVQGEKKDKFWDRFFKKKELESERRDIPVKKDSIVLKETIKAIDTTIAIGIDKNILQDEISRLQVKEGKKQKRLTAYEINLRTQNDSLSVRLYKLISKLEKEEIESSNQKADDANRMVGITQHWSLVFMVMFGVLLIIVVFIVQRYTNKTHATQVALTQAKDAALKLSQTKEQFLANMSHEIRTPMNAIVGFTEQILQMDLQQQSREQLQIVKKSADHLLRLINDILDYSKLEAGKLTLESHPFDIVEVIQQTYQLYKPSADLKNIALKTSGNILENPVLIGDSFRLRQIIYNLISNAIKFTNEGEVEMITTYTDEHNNCVNLHVEVRDTGIGIPEEKLNTIFDEFTQAESSTARSFGGTGLGLAIVHKLVEIHDGIITVNNKPDAGTSFHVIIPYRIGKMEMLVEESQSSGMQPQTLKPFKILAADDDSYNQKLIAYILEKWNVEYKVVKNGKEALDELVTSAYDLFLLDIHMPGMSGVEVAKTIRSPKFKGNPGIPIILLTANIAQKEINECNGIGIHDVLLKPYTEKQLFGKIKDVLQLEVPEVAVDKIPPKLKMGESAEKQSGSEDFKSLYELAGNDKLFVCDMLKMFLEKTPEDLAGMTKFYNEKDWHNLAETAHRIKSPCKHLNAQKLATDLKQLELTARDGNDVQEIDELFNVSYKQIEQLMLNVKEHLECNFPETVK